MIHIKKLVCVCSVLIAVIPQTSSLKGAYEYRGLGWPAAMANIRVIGSHNSQFALNPSLMHGALHPVLSLSYQKPFQGLDLQAGAFNIQHGIGQNPFIHNLEFFGDEYYSEIRLSSGTAWSFQHELSGGITLSYHHLELSGYQSQQAISLSLSSSIRVNSQLEVGTVMENVIQSGSDLSLPQKFYMGGAYSIGPTSLMLSLEKESALPVELGLGFLYASSTFWEAGFGYRDLSGKVSLGWRIHLSKFAFYYAVVTHPQLPVSHGFGLDITLP